MRSADCVSVWGAGEPGESETDAVGPAGSTESVPCTKLREGVCWTTDVVEAGFCGALAVRGGYSKNRSEIVVGGTRGPPAAGRAIDGDDGCRNLSEGSLGRSRKVVKPHTWQVCTKSQRSAEVKGSPPKALLSVRGISPPKPTPGSGEEGVCSPQALMRYQVYATVLNRGETCRTIAFMFRGSLRQARKGVGVAVRASFAVLGCVVERDEKLEPSLDTGVVVPHFAYAFQCLVEKRIYDIISYYDTWYFLSYSFFKYKSSKTISSKILAYERRNGKCHTSLTTAATSVFMIREECSRSAQYFQDVIMLLA